MKIFKGKIISTNKKNTVTVLVDSMKVHRLYKKRFVRSKKYHVHDDFGCSVGETVNFTASRPYSKMVKWKTVKTGNIISKKEDKSETRERSLKKQVKGKGKEKKS